MNIISYKQLFKIIQEKLIYESLILAQDER
jgi:hypothetical protein